ncbi:hypothetical protein JHK85_007368 [Glycine max]|nr:hypothetical protein JHK85_007368 [Glycine max]KAG5071947.1 hypothetical protein JHK86_007158 [Glycine max]
MQEPFVLETWTLCMAIAHHTWWQVVFSRPIHWILALHGDVVPFMFAGGDELLGVETEFVDVVPCILLEFPSHLTTSFSPLPAFCLGDAAWV